MRFLHVVAPGHGRGRPVDEAIVDGERLVSWEEAVEREVAPGPFAIPAGT